MPDFSFGIERSDVFALTEGYRTAYELFIGWSLAAVDRQIYQNYKTPRYKGFYGYAQLMQGEFVVDTIPLEYVNQRLWYHRDVDLVAADAAACSTKLLAQCACNTELLAYATKMRIWLTAIRFRLEPGIAGNCVVRYRDLQSSCDNEIRQPDPQEGNPPSGDNGGYNPGSQPGDSKSDPNDPSGNDGQDPNAPSPSAPTGMGEWQTDVIARNPDFPLFTFRAPGKITDDYQVESAPPYQTSECPNGKPRLRGVLNGQEVWITNNCISTVEAVVEKRFVPG